MKSLHFFILLMFFVASGMSQEINIETQSVSVENLIPFIVETYPTSNEDEESQNKKITFLLQTSSGELSTEDAVIYKYAFRLLSERLSENDLISIVAYSGLNGIALDALSPKEIKKILYTIDNLSTSIKEFYPDGIDLAYAYAKENFIEEAQNSVVMIRNPNIQSDVPLVGNATEVTNKPEQKNNTILLTAIALLPQIISVIKD